MIQKIFLFYFHLILNFNIEFKCNTKYVLSLIHLSQSLFFIFLFYFFFVLWQYVQLLGEVVVFSDRKPSGSMASRKAQKKMKICVNFFTALH